MRIRHLIILLALHLAIGFSPAYSCTITDSPDEMRRLLASFLAERSPMLALYVSKQRNGQRTFTIDQSGLDVATYTDGRYPTAYQTSLGVLESVRATIDRYPSYDVNFIMVYDPSKLAYVLAANVVDPQPSNCALLNN